MPSLAQSGSLRGVDVNGKNVVAAGIILLVIAALIFLPEIMSSPEPSGRAAQVSSQISLDDFEPQAVAYDEPAFVEVSEQVSESPRASQKISVQQQELVHSPVYREDSGSPSPLEQLLHRVSRTPHGTQMISKTEPFFDADRIHSWEDVLTPTSTQKLQRAREDIRKLARSIPQRYSRTRFALIGYSEGIDAVLSRGAGEVLSPREVIPYLSSLDMAVTESMVAERIDRTFLRQWANISIGPELESTSQREQHLNELTQFRPLIRITNLSIEQPSNSRGEFVPENDVAARMRGEIHGNDVTRLVMFRQNDPHRRSVVTLSRPDGNGVRIFNVHYFPRIQNTAVIFEAQDAEGNVFQKAYNFHPRVLRFPWGGPRHRSSFVLPFGFNDPKMDAYFAIANSRGQPRSAGGRGSEPIIGRF